MSTVAANPLGAEVRVLGAEFGGALQGVVG